MHRLNNYYTVSEWLDISQISSARELSVEIAYEEIKNLDEHYRIRIQEDKITITSGTKRGLSYANRTLQELLQQDRLYYGLIEDGPAFPMRGIIEGFYGEPWSHDDRKDVIMFLSKYRMNTYMYAPKDDAYHRHKWREPYPKEELSKLVELIRLSQDNLIDFYFCISPGNDFNYTKEADFIALFTKIDAITSYGVTHFCLLLDDIDYQLQGQDLEQFETPGKAHAYISNRLQQHLNDTLENHTLVMCPTEYWQRTDSPYRQDLKTHLEDDILVFWTGYNTVAEFIPNSDGELVKEFFGHELVLWDNYPVNDMATDMIFMGPLCNRGDQLHHTHVGFLSNPMVEWSLSKLPIITMSEYMWNPATYEPEQAYKRAIASFAKEKQYIDALETVLPNFRHSLIHYTKDDTIEHMIQSNNKEGLLAYYDTVIEAVHVLRTMPDERFKEQFEPWWKRLELDRDLVTHIVEDDSEQIQVFLKKMADIPHTTGSQYAVKLAKKLGLYDGPIYRKERPNYWR